MGCSTSKNANFIVLPETLSTNPRKSVSWEKPNSQSTRFLENCLVIWFCNETSDKFENEREQLRKIIYGLKIFNNIDGCIAFITQVQDEKVFLIISGTLRIVERFQYLSSLEKIYLFSSCSLKLSYEKHHDLKYDIVENFDNLYNQLQEDIKLCEMDFILVTIAPSSSQKNSSSSKQESAFLFSQMLKEVIYRLKFESGSKDVFIDFCRTHYANNYEQLSVIEDFAKNYRPNKALLWFTKRCFVAQILNRVLRTREIDIIYKLGFFIKQIHIQLNRLHEENASLMKNISIVYRGKTMSNNEFDNLLKDKQGDLFSFVNFLTATTNKEVAMNFVGCRLAVRPDMIGIIFEIHMDHTIFSEKNPYALLKDSDMDKDEICFHMSTVFRIESIEQTINDTTMIWFVKLKLISDDNRQLVSIVASTRNDEVHVNPVSHLGKLLITMGEYRRAEEVFLGLLQDASVLSQPRRLTRVHNGLGFLYTYMNEYTKALDHYQKTLQASLIYLQSNHPDLAPIYKAIADTYLNQHDYIHAIENYEKAIELLKQSTQQTNSEILTDLLTHVKKAKESIKSNK